jgi:hypothetical protein
LIKIKESDRSCQGFFFFFSFFGFLN